MLVYRDKIQNRTESKNVAPINFRPIIDKLNGQDLAQSLEQAKSRGLITMEQWKLLDKYRNGFKNSYSQAEKKKILKSLKKDNQYYD